MHGIVMCLFFSFFDFILVGAMIPQIRGTISWLKNWSRRILRVVKVDSKPFGILTRTKINQCSGLNSDSLSHHIFCQLSNEGLGTQ